MKGNFKAGDKVKIIKATSGAWGTNGRIGIVVEKPQNARGRHGIVSCENGVWVELVDDGKIWNIGTESELELIKDIQSVHITTKGNETIAVLKNGKETIKVAKAKCSPSDTFSFEIGAKLAVERLFGADKPGVKEVKRIAKAGEWIKIVEKGNHRPHLVIGDIHKVAEINGFRDIFTDKASFFGGKEHDEYVVLENYQPKTSMMDALHGKPEPKTLVDYTKSELLEELLRREK